jgi:hypothetical protein
VKPIERGALHPPSAYRFYPARWKAGLQFCTWPTTPDIFQQRTAKAVPQPQPPDSLHAPVRVLMAMRVKPGERPELRDDVRGQEPAVWPE